MRKKFWKRMRRARKFATKLLGYWPIRNSLELILTVSVIYFGVIGASVLALRTDEPWASVMSDSMKHSDESWRDYFESEGMRRTLLMEYLDPSDTIQIFDTSKFPLQGGFERGDMLIIQGVESPDQLKVGDVVVAEVGGRFPLTHRIFHMWGENGETRIMMKGDGNKYVSPVEKSVEFKRIKGKVIFVIPKLGWLSIWWRS